MYNLFLTNRRFKRMIANILSIFIILVVAFPATGAVSAQESAPSLRAHPEWESVDGWYWPLGAELHLTIEDPNTAKSPDLEMSKIVDVVTEPPDNNSVWFEFRDTYDLKPGDEVTLTDGQTTRSLLVSVLSINAVDVDADTIAGIAEPGSTVRLPIPEELFATADDNGNWYADFGALELDLTPGMTVIAEVYDEDGDLTSFERDIPRPLWRDDFDGPLSEPWYWVNENPDKWNLTENPGFLRIYTSPGGAGAENLLLRPVAQGDFTIKTHLLFEPNTDFQFAGLVIWQDENNFLQLGRAFCDVEGACVGNGLYFDKILGGNFTDSNFATAINNPSEVSLRLERRGNMVRAFYSLDEGMTWHEIGIHGIPDDFQVNAVGLTASQNTGDSDIPADFDFFELSEGWGFLPEGFHDYDQGDVPNWACNAGGWAADPDDRAADVNIEVVVDDQTVANLVAGEFRQDLADAGVCVDGNCSFSTSLWDLISSYEPHRVDVWAQDNSNGDWVLLSNSGKTLTCRTYDIYTFDPETGAIKQITNLRDMQEYNPRWSPDGTKIVHDAWAIDWSSHAVYITDLKSGVSTPLAGAEGGSYPIWAPNGKWIAFDRGADNDYRIFIVPPSGGVPTLVREDAFMATWAPDSKRLAFHQQSDGSIRTIELKTGKETLVVTNGNAPAWSPHGDWIAFERDGDIWKIGVNKDGNPVGDPIQLTSSPLFEARPTWSNNNKTIAFHAGMGDDNDIWAVPAAGGAETWLNGASTYGDYDPNYSFNGRYISYSSFSPDGQAPRQWIAAYTYDAGTWDEGEHTYHFEAQWDGGSETSNDVSFNVSSAAQLYDGYALLRPGAVRAGFDCPAIDTIHPNQPTRFLAGYLTDTPMTYSQALAYFSSLTASAIWDVGQSATLAPHEILPYKPDAWFQYVCSFISP